jgi:hypothetical protein
MHEVERHLDCKVSADRAWRSFDRVCCADHLPRRVNCLLTFEHQRDNRPARYELDQLTEERLFGMLGVVSLGELTINGHLFERGDAQALALEARDDLTGEASFEAIGLDQDQGLVDRAQGDLRACSLRRSEDLAGRSPRPG